MAGFIETLDQMMDHYVQAGLLQNTIEVESLDGSIIHIDGYELVNFGSCGYMGLEYQAALRDGITEALGKYGLQFSTSRSYLSVSLYKRTIRIRASHRTLNSCNSRIYELTKVCHRKVVQRQTLHAWNRYALPAKAQRQRVPVNF